MTPGHLDRPALFEEASHLFTALHLLLPRNDPYPADVLLIPDRGWAVDVDVLASRPNLIALISQHGWKVVFPPARVEGQWVPLAAALRGKWTYRDPLRAAEWAAGSMAPPPESSSWAWLDPSAHGMQFLLAAKDEARAQRILDVLSLHLAQGIRAVPILLKPGAAVPPRFRYYWNVFVERPNPFLFEPADGVWWGPVGHGPVDIFLEYPWSLAVPPDLLDRFSWMPNTGIVLLSREAPHVTELSLAPDGNTFTDYVGIVDVVTGAAQVSLPVVSTQPAPDKRFTVAVILGGPDRRVADLKRINELRREIAAKQSLLEQMLVRGGHREHEDIAGEPLFLYAQQHSDRGRIPAEIQRLLLEWTDLPEDLGAISYAYLPGDALPKSQFAAGTSLHVVTATTALGVGGDFAVGARLLDYAPQSLNSWNLTLDEDWAIHGLRLFAPAGDHLWLYPNLRPSRAAAAQFASAIDPGVGADRGSWLYLVLPDLQRQPHFMLIPASAFTPLSVAFEWVLDIDTGISLPEAARSLRGRTAAAVCDAIDGSLTEAMAGEATARLNAVTGRLRAEVVALAGRLNERTTRVTKVSDTATHLDQQASAVQQSLTDTDQILKELDPILQAVEKSLGSSGIHLKRLETAVRRHKSVQQKLHDQIAALNDVRSRWKK